MTTIDPGKISGTRESNLEATLNMVNDRFVINRIWRKDHTVWKPESTEITDRLGWLTAVEHMQNQIPHLVNFANEIKRSGFRHVVLLGVGGSILGADVLKNTFPSPSGYPELIVLDSSVPDRLIEVTETIDIGYTLFIVASKSGSTIESTIFYSYFREQVDRVVGQSESGQRFIAITDPGTPLEKLAQDDKFRRVFLNLPDIGGRYSVLSYFGLIPASLAGIDIVEILNRANRMGQACYQGTSTKDNPGAWLGIYTGALALQGRDKLTLITTPSIDRFGLWVEQLIAESTGKEGKGIIPIVGEPFVDAYRYGEDRLFVYLRMDEDNCYETDFIVEEIASAGHPIMHLNLCDKYDIGAEFFRWKFAIVVASVILGVNPFDQPNVQGSKDETERVMMEYIDSGELPQLEPFGSESELLSQAEAGDYLSIMAYDHQTPETDMALYVLRKYVMENFKLATTLGYGPTFLHSTGQLHKGGPNTGLFLQIVPGSNRDVAAPDKPYTFGMLSRAQADGDLKTLRALGKRVARVIVDPWTLAKQNNLNPRKGKTND